MMLFAGDPLRDTVPVPERGVLRDILTTRAHPMCWSATGSLEAPVNLLFSKDWFLHVSTSVTRGASTLNAGEVYLMFFYGIC